MRTIQFELTDPIATEVDILIKQKQFNDEIELIERALLEFMEHHQTARVVARYDMDGEIYEITQADVEAVRVRMVKPRSEKMLYELALVYKMAKLKKTLSREESFKQLMESVEKCRADAIADGTAIDYEWEAAIGD